MYPNGTFTIQILVFVLENIAFVNNALIFQQLHFVHLKMGLFFVILDDAQDFFTERLSIHQEQRIQNHTEYESLKLASKACCYAKIQQSNQSHG